jgi:hypothetical protein
MPVVSSSEAALLDIIRRKLLGYPASDDNPLSLPQAQLMAMDLRSMLAVVRAIAKYRLVVDRYTADPDAQQIILAASRVLMDWPKNFSVLLKDIGQQASSGDYVGVGKQYGDIYRALFRNPAITPSTCVRGIYLTPPNATGCGLTRVANGAGSVCIACWARR